MNLERGGRMIGFAAALATAAIWASWQVLTRIGAQSFDISLLALLRYAIPTAIFVPVLLRIGVAPPQVPRGLLAVTVLSGGLGFVLLAALALRHAPAAEVAPIFPGTPPLFVALYAALIDKERFGPLRHLGFALILVGLLVIILPPILAAGRVQPGHVIALGAGLDWAIFTIAYRHSRLGAVEAAALISFWSALIIAPFGVMPLIGALAAQAYTGLAVQVAIQSIGTGLAATILFGVAVNRIGGPSTSALTALTPALSALFGILLLGEWPNADAQVGIVVIFVGVILANWPRRALAARPAELA